MIVDDRQDQVFASESEGNIANHSTFQLHLPRVDLDVMDSQGNEVPEEQETNANNYFYPGNEELLQLKLRKFEIAAALKEFGGGVELAFQSSQVRIWKSEEKNPNDKVTTETLLEIDQDHTLFVEVINSGTVEIDATYQPDAFPEHVKQKGPDASDTVKLQVVGADLDIGLHDSSPLSEFEEDDPGITIDLGADKDELANLTIRSLIPEALNYAADFFTLDFDDTILKIWNKNDDFTGLDSLEEITMETQFDASQAVFSVWVEAFELAETTISLVWHETGNESAATMVFDSVAVTTVGLRDVDILLAIGGTGSDAWLNSGDPSISPGGTGKTVDGSRWLSHLRNWAETEINGSELAGHYGDGEEDRGKFLNGPDAPILFFGSTAGALGQDVPDIITSGYEWVSKQYWKAFDSGAEPKVDIVGMSRGGMIASQIAWRIQFLGYSGGNASGENSMDHKDIRFIGLFDPVDQANSVEPIRKIPENVSLAAVGYSTNFSGNRPREVSRFYWDKISYEGHVPKAFAATHSAFQGSPTYSTDPGRHIRGIPNKDGESDHPTYWLQGYSDAKDIAGSIAADSWFRSEARSVFVPIDLLTTEDYRFNRLHKDPNPASPNHNTGYSAP